MLGPASVQLAERLRALPGALAVAFDQPLCALRVNSNGIYAAGYARLAYSCSAAAVGPPSCSGPGMAILFLNNLARSCPNLLIAFLFSDFIQKVGRSDLLRRMPLRLPRTTVHPQLQSEGWRINDFD